MMDIKRVQRSYFGDMMCPYCYGVNVDWTDSMDLLECGDCGESFPTDEGGE